MLPDADVIGLRVGVPYGGMLGHRGVTHSLIFACLVGLAATALFWVGVRPWERFQIALCIAVATASHGILDAFTDGGRGVAFFSPFDAARYFFPVTPIKVSPLGAQAFFSQRGLSVLASELAWVWCPAMLVMGIVIAMRSLRASREHSVD
jgi:inner membrane protein